MFATSLLSPPAADRPTAARTTLPAQAKAAATAMAPALDPHPRLLRISVADHRAPRAAHHDGEDPAAIAVAPPIEPDEHGRGLAIVCAHATWVGIVHDETGCRVVAVVRLGTRARPPRS